MKEFDNSLVKFEMALLYVRHLDGRGRGQCRLAGNEPSHLLCRNN